MNILKNLLYTMEHEWIKVEGNKVYLGITDFAQKALGAIVYVELPEVDVEYSTGDGFAVIESVKAASDVYIPLDGKVIEVNEVIADEPGLVNENPYANWIALIELRDESQLDGLLSAKAYEEFCSKEE
jgi:glycine cleavage system H protein